MTGTWPMLARVPAGDLIDRVRHEPKLRAAEVLYSDTAWRSCTVLAWARHRGGWAVLIRWRDGREDWREYDPRHIRPGDPPALGRRASRRSAPGPFIPSGSSALGSQFHTEGGSIARPTPVFARLQVKI